MIRIFKWKQFEECPNFIGIIRITLVAVLCMSLCLSRFSYHHRKHSSGGSGAEQLVRSRTTDSLQKTMPGGIFLIELSFQEVYFVVKLYVFSASQIGQSRQPHYKSNLKVHLP